MLPSFQSVIAGCGMFVPSKIVTNDDLSEILDTNDEWIRGRTGIRCRHIASSKDTVASLGTEAAYQALLAANVQPMDVDAIILATTSPDHFMPATAMRIQDNLKAKKAFAFDIQAVCSGFIYALSIADQFIRTKMVSNVLVIGSEIMSRMLDWTDRSTCVLFGDGAGAVLLQAQDNTNSGILSSHLFSDGGGYDMLYSNDQIITEFKRGGVVMNGRAVYSKAIESMESSLRIALQYNHLDISDLDWFIAHQANKRIIDSVRERLNLPDEKAIITIDSYANTSSATIPISLATAVQDGRIQKGNIVAFSAMGAGFTWGSALIRW